MLIKNNKRYQYRLEVGFFLNFAARAPFVKFEAKHQTVKLVYHCFVLVKFLKMKIIQ